MPEKQKGILNTFRNLYSSWDLFAASPGLSVNGNGNSKSVIGSTLSLGCLFITFYLSSKTIQNVFLAINPSITFDAIQGTNSLSDLNFTNFFMSYSFFTPISMDNKRFSNDTNDFNLTSTMSTVLGDCLHDCSNKTFYMGICNKTFFNEIPALKGLPIGNSKNVTKLFQTQSYCLPSQFQATLKDHDENRTNFISSFSIFIPDTYKQHQNTKSKRMLSKILI